jgi:peroxiredoxin
MMRHRIVAMFSLAALAAAPALASALAIGSKAPQADVKMKGVDGKEVSIEDVAGPAGTLVVFTCNHCPWAKAWESRIVELGNAYRQKGIGVIAINANDPKEYPVDGIDGMVERAKERDIQYPYVVDATSNVARAFGATRTPEAFLFDKDGRLVYHGSIDDNAQEPDKVDKRYLKDALDDVVVGRDVAVKETKSIGCSIKFRS